MEEPITDCRTGEERRRQFTAAEVEQRLAEIAAAELEAKKQERKQLKAELLDVRQSLKEARKAEEEGLDFAEEIAQLEFREEEIKQELKDG